MNKKHEIISVIMPAYNSGKTIEMAIRSVMDQSYPYTEVIVVDNSSKDDTVAVAERLAGEYFFEDENGGKIPRIKVIVQENKGVSSARNTAIREIGGELFASLDSDDYYDKDTIKIMYESMKAEDSDVVIGGMRKVYETDGVRDEEFVPEDGFGGDVRSFMDKAFTGLYDLHLISTHSNKLYKASIIRENDIYYNEKLAVNEDIDFVLRYLKACRRVSVVKDIFLNYVQHGVGQSLINTFQPHGLEGALIVLRSFNALAEKTGASERCISGMDERLFVHICSFAGLMYYRSNYSDEKILGEIRKLCSDADFQCLLHRMRAEGLKNSIAAFLLKNRMAGAYHFMCRLIYRNK